MTNVVEQLKAQAGALSPPERADLAYFLIQSLDGPAEEGVEEAWRAEIARRVADIRAGTAAGRPVDDVLAELRQRYP
jgi:putative addiction module component (TIGR02574 family)